MRKKLEEMNFLIVDSNPAIAERIRSVVCATGLCKEARLAYDSHEAMEQMRTTAIEFVIVDHSNLEFVRTLRTRESFKELPILLALSPIHKQDAAKAIEAGIDQFIQKPLMLDELLEKIAIMLK